MSANTHSVIPIWFYFSWNTVQPSGCNYKNLASMHRSQISSKYLPSKLKQATFVKNTWANTLLCADLSETTTLKKYVDLKTPVSQLSLLFLLLQRDYFLVAYYRNKSPHWITREVASYPYISISHPRYFSAKPPITCTAQAKCGSDFLTLKPNPQHSSEWLAALNTKI